MQPGLGLPQVNLFVGQSLYEGHDTVEDSGRSTCIVLTIALMKDYVIGLHISQ